MSTTQYFLDEYKTLEGILTKNNLGTVLDYENNLPEGKDKNKLKLCRIIRNYIVHEDAKFIVPSTEMVKFIMTLKDKVDGKGVTLNKRAYTVKFTEDTKVSEIVNFLAKKKLYGDIDIPIYDKIGLNVIGAFKTREIINLISKGEYKQTTKVSVVKKGKMWDKVNFPSYSGNTLLDEVRENGTVIVDGKGWYIL